MSEVKNISDVDADHATNTDAFEYYTNYDFETSKHVLYKIGYPMIRGENKLKTKVQSYVSCAIGRVKQKNKFKK